MMAAVLPLLLLNRGDCHRIAVHSRPFGEEDITPNCRIYLAKTHRTNPYVRPTRNSITSASTRKTMEGMLTASQGGQVLIRPRLEKSPFMM